MHIRKLGPVTAALLAGFAGGVLSNLVWTQATALAQGQSPTAVPATVKAQEFQLVDPKGVVIGEFKSGLLGGEFTLYNRRGEATWYAPQWQGPRVHPLTQSPTP